MTETIQSNWRKGIRYGAWTIVVYALIFFLLRALTLSMYDFFFRPGTWASWHIGIWYIIFQLFPFVVGFIFLVTGYSALKGDKAQIIPAIIHGVILAFWVGMLCF